MRAVTLTLHPAVDRICEIGAMLPGGTFSAQPMLTVPAGKGVNTARSLSSIWPGGGKIVAAVWIGSDQASWFEKWLRDHNGIQSAAISRECATRSAYTFLEKSGRETHIKEIMRAAQPREERELKARWAKIVRRDDLISLCGSAPAKTSASTLRELFAIAKKRGASKIIADTNGAALDIAGAAGLDGIKGNAAEIGAWLKLRGPLNLSRATDRDTLLNAFKRSGAPKCILITMGARGAALATPSEIVSATPPRLPKKMQRAATGCGDAATAGWMWAIRETCPCPPEEALRRAVACGTAKLASADPGSLDRYLVERLRKEVRVERY